jgi:hypothetical protein
MSVVLRITALNMHLISGHRIVAIADLRVGAWSVTLRRCYWKRENGHDRVGLPCNAISFHSDGDAHRFQQAAQAAMRELAKKLLEDSAQ